MALGASSTIATLTSPYALLMLATSGFGLAKNSWGGEKAAL